MGNSLPSPVTGEEVEETGMQNFRTMQTPVGQYLRFQVGSVFREVAQPQGFVACAVGGGFAGGSLFGPMVLGASQSDGKAIEFIGSSEGWRQWQGSVSVEDVINEHIKTHMDLQNAVLRSGRAQVPQQPAGSPFGVAISGQNFLSGSHVSAQMWLAEIFCSEIQVLRQGVEVNVRRNEISKQIVKEMLGSKPIHSRTSFRHAFKRDGVGVIGDDILTLQNIGFFHAFVMLDLDDNKFLCVEKYADKLEVIVGEGLLAKFYAVMFRATGQERPGDWNPDHAGRPMLAQEKVAVANNDVQDVMAWLEQEVNVNYDVLTQNCQTFADKLCRFLDSKREIRK